MWRARQTDDAVREEEWWCQQPQQVGQQHIRQIIKLLVIFAQYGLEYALGVIAGRGMVFRTVGSIAALLIGLAWPMVKHRRNTIRRSLRLHSRLPALRLDPSPSNSTGFARRYRSSLGRT